MCPGNNPVYWGFLHVSPLYPTKELWEQKGLSKVCYHPCIRACSHIVLELFISTVYNETLVSCCCRRLKDFAVNGQRREEMRASSKQRKQNLAWVRFCLEFEFIHYMTIGRSHHVVFPLLPLDISNHNMA